MSPPHLGSPQQMQRPCRTAQKALKEAATRSTPTSWSFTSPLSPPNLGAKRASGPSCVKPLWGAPCHATAILAKGAEGFVAPHAALNVMQLLTEKRELAELTRQTLLIKHWVLGAPSHHLTAKTSGESRDRLSVVSNGSKRIAARGDPEANGSSWQCPAACERDATDSELLGCPLQGNSPQLRSHAP